MHLWFQALSRLHIPQFSSLDDVFPSRLIIWRTENFSAARIIPAPNDLAYQKIRWYCYHQCRYPCYHLDLTS
jgi:hypothetical protein